LGCGEANRTEKKSCRYDGAIDSDSHHNLLRRHGIARRFGATLMRKVAVQLTQINVLCRRYPREMVALGQKQTYAGDG
jgi:hypothetical protein